MTIATAELLVDLCGLYASLGAIFGVAFLWRMVGRLDPAALHATWGFRVVVFPGVVLLWPFLLMRVLRGATMPPDEWTAHRARARRGRTRVEVLR